MNDNGKKIIAGVVLVAGLMSAGISANAAVLIEWQDGTVGHTFDNWAGPIERIGGGAAEGTMPAPPTTIGGETAVSLTANTSGDFVPHEDVIYTTDPNMLGNFSDGGVDPLGVAGISFDFYAGADGIGNGGAPDALSLYFQSTTAVWYYEISSASITDGWGSYYVDFSYASGWVGYDDNTEVGAVRTSGEWDTDIAGVTQLGFSVQYASDLDGQQYAFDDIGLSVPEPETYLILGMALLSVAIVFRKRISESLAEARAMMQV